LPTFSCPSHVPHPPLPPTPSPHLTFHTLCLERKDWMPDGDETDETVRRGEFTASNHMSVTNGFSAHGLELLAEMLAAGGRTDNATVIAAEAASLKAAIVKYMWNGTHFCDGVCSEVGGNSRVMTNMFFLVFGLIPEANINQAWDVVANWGLEQIGDYGAFFYQNAIAGGYYSPYYDTPDDGTAIVTALSKCDEYSWCIGLLNDNLTMTRESWRDGTYSHGWGSSAIVGVSWGVLGIHQTSPAFATFTVKPKLGPLAFANGTVPTLRGYITVNAGAGGVLDADVPCNTLATLCTPRSSLDATIFTTATHVLLLDGQPAPAISSAGHLCLSKPVSCGAMGATRSLRVSPRA
jgi:hypothetical protein